MALKLADALRLASKDAQFAQDLIKDPAAFKDTFGLTQNDIDSIKKATVQEIAEYGAARQGGVQPKFYY